MTTRFDHSLHQTEAAPSALQELRTEYRRIIDTSPKGSCNEIITSNMIMSFNMQGAGTHNKNIKAVKKYIKEHKPAIIGLQEVRSKSGISGFETTPEYAYFSHSNDTVTLIRHDIQVIDTGQVPGLQLPHDRVTIKTDNGNIKIINLYARDNSLTLNDLTIISKGKRTITIGDFNAKHIELLPHTQKTKTNNNGKILYSFLNKVGSTDETHNPGLVLLNSQDENVYTHTNGEGGWVQIDLMLCTLDLEIEAGTMEYDSRLRSDHIAIAIPLEGLLSPLYKVKSSNEILLWDKFRSIEYKAITEAELYTLQQLPEWKFSSVEDKVKLFTDIQTRAMNITLPRKKSCAKGKPIPLNLLKKVRQRRSLKIKLKALTVQKRRKQVAEVDQEFPPPGVQGPMESPLWTDDIILLEEGEAPNNRKKIYELDKEINEGFKEFRNKNWELQLKKLSELNPDKASKKFWNKIKKLSGSKGVGVIATIKYKDTTARSPQEVANLLGNYYTDTFQPLQDKCYDYEYFQEVTSELAMGLDKLKEGNPRAPTSEITPLSSSYLVDTTMEPQPDFITPNPTKHQKKEWGAEYTNKYRKIKNALQGNIFNHDKINNDWQPRLDKDHRKVNKKIGLKELNAAIKKMKRKAPGHDRIFIDYFIHLSRSGKQCLLQIYNEIYSKGDMPATWKNAILAPLLKKGKNGQKPESYRPISLLPVGGKILEGIILPRINGYMELRGLIPCHQTGFRKGMSTSINIKRLYNHTYLQTARSSLGRPTVAVLFDAKKAFDTVWHD